MIPRKRMDIGWGDLLCGMARCMVPGGRDEIYAACSRHTNAPDRAAFFLSVRSGFDAVLQALGLPEGSQVLVHAMTNPDMLEILKAHHLIAVPVDVDPLTLCPETAWRKGSERIQSGSW